MPMSKKGCSILREIADDLDRIGVLIQKYQLADPMPVEKLFGFVGKYKQESSECCILQTEFHLPVDGLKVNRHLGGKDTNKNCDCQEDKNKDTDGDIDKNKRVCLDVDLKFALSKEETWDPFSAYSCNFEFSLDGKTCFAWHLDRELETDGDFVHPLYHFQAGGKRMEGVGCSAVCFLSSPRLPHPPLDPILLIHFVVQNFINSGKYSSKKDLLEDVTYQDAVNKARERILQPYFNSIISDKLERQTLSAYKLFPLLGCTP